MSVAAGALSGVSRGRSLVAVSGDYSLLVVYWFLVAVVSLFGTHRLSSCEMFPEILIPS